MLPRRLITLAERLRPVLKTVDEPRRSLMLLDVVLLLITGPLSLVALAWLLRLTDGALMGDHALLGLALAAALLVMQQYIFTIQVEVTETDLVPITGSLASLVVWSTALIFGPTALWLMVFVHMVWAARTAWNARRIGQEVVYASLSQLAQGLGSETFGALVALAFYRALGGAYPLHASDTNAWLIALAASVVAALLPLLVMTPVIMLIQRLERGDRPGVMAGWWRSLMLFSVVSLAPFSLLGAAIYVEINAQVFLLLIAGVVAVNTLLHQLSQTNERSQQRARELARLEVLGQALIEAPADLSTLEAALAAHVPTMFPRDRFELRLFAPEGSAPPGLAWPDCSLILPPERPPVDEAAWTALWEGADPLHYLAQAQPPGTTGTYGDALLVKITADDPGREGGEKEKLLGGLALGRRKPQGKAVHSLAALQSLAAQIGAAYYRAQVHFETLAAQRMAQELALAGRIQASFLPGQIPSVPGWDLAAGLVPARQTSGDFFDFIPLPDGRWGILVADVADKGMAAALYMALVRTLLRTFAAQFPDAPERTLTAANDRILIDAPSDQFVTVFYGVLNPASGALTYANAGHNPALLLRAADGGACPEALRFTGVPLGMFEGMTWTRAERACAPGDLLLLYTDGVTEAQNEAGDPFGEERLEATARHALRASADGVRHAVSDAVRQFAGGAPVFDDITLLVARRADGL